MIGITAWTRLESLELPRTHFSCLSCLGTLRRSDPAGIALGTGPKTLLDPSKVGSGAIWSGLDPFGRPIWTFMGRIRPFRGSGGHQEPGSGPSVGRIWGLREGRIWTHLGSDLDPFGWDSDPFGVDLELFELNPVLSRLRDPRMMGLEAIMELIPHRIWVLGSS